MRSSDDVFQLIKSLTKSEKRYFKLTASMQRGEKNYLRLFDLLNEMPEYDEEGVREHFAGERFINQLNVARRYLYDMILKSLRAFHNDYSPKAEIHDLLTSADILRAKGLVDQALPLVDKAIEIAESIEAFAELTAAYTAKQLCLPESQLSGEEIVERFDAFEGAIDKQWNLVQYQRLLAHVNRTQVNGHARTSEDYALLERCRRHPLMASISNARSVRARFLHLAVIGHYDYEHANYEALPQVVNEQIALFNDHPWMMMNYPLWYLTTLHHRALLYKVLDKREQYHEAIAELRRNGEALLAHKRLASAQLQAMIFATTYLSLLTYHAGIGTFDEAQELVMRVEEGMTEHARHLDVCSTIRLYSALADIQFGRGAYRSALDYNNCVLSMPEPKSSVQIYHRTRLQNLFIHYELGNFDLLDYLIPSATRYLSSRGLLEPFERTILHYLGRLTRATADAKRRATLEAFRAELVKLSQDPESRTQFYFFHYVEWVTSKIERRPYAEVIQEWIAGQHRMAMAV